jgi:hypothetical protein
VAKIEAKETRLDEQYSEALRDQIELADPTNPLHDLEASTRREAIYAGQELLKQARWLRDKMVRLVDDLERNGVYAHPNSLGEVQGNGLGVDLACALFSERKKALANIQRVGEKEVAS